MVALKTVSPTEAWQTHHNKWKDCNLCPLCHERYRIVLGRGSIPCDMLLVGEAPGESENLLGQPFKGPAGKLFDDVLKPIFDSHPTITYAMTNLVACFPKTAKEVGTNEPEDNEIRACGERLREFVDIVRPRLIVCVGGLATKWVPMILPSLNIPTCSITHPAAMLPGRMPVVQSEFAVQKVRVTLTTAIEKYLIQ